MQKILKLVVTGGPCAGKSCALHRLPKDLKKAGYHPIVVPEAATAMFLAGFTFEGMGTVAFQKTLMQTQKALEQSFMEGAKQISDATAVLICDRGMMDGKAYMSDADYEAQIRAFSMTEADVYAAYDAVFYMETAALRYPDAYSNSNNKTRYETPSQAIEVDSRLRQVWSGHPHFYSVCGAVSFDEKYRNLKEKLLRFLAQEMQETKEELLLKGN